MDKNEIKEIIWIGKCLTLILILGILLNILVLFYIYVTQ